MSGDWIRNLSDITSSDLQALWAGLLMAFLMPGKVCSKILQSLPPLFTLTGPPPTPGETIPRPAASAAPCTPNSFHPSLPLEGSLHTFLSHLAEAPQ